MLFKYLIGAFALAATTVMSSPTEDSGFVATPQAKYEKCLTTIAEVKQPVITSCNTGQVDEVKKHLKKVVTPVVEVSTRYKSSIKIEKTKAVYESHQFIEVLKRFNEVLVVIYNHPDVSASCTDVFSEFNFNFQIIFIQFVALGLDIHKSIQEAGLDLAVWMSLGFKFYSSY